MENKTPVKKKNNSIMVNVAPLMLRGTLVSNTDGVYNQAAIC